VSLAKLPYGIAHCYLPPHISEHIIIISSMHQSEHTPP